MTASYTDNHPSNVNMQMMAKFSPKVALGQDINAVFQSQNPTVSGAVGSVQSYQGNQFQALNNKLKQKKHMMNQFGNGQAAQQQMLNARSVGGLSNFMQSYNQIGANMQQTG